MCTRSGASSAGFPILVPRPIIDRVTSPVVYAEAIGLTLAVLVGACGTTVIVPQPGRQWCVEVQSPSGSVSDPTALNQVIVDPKTGMDPRGCLCFTAAQDQALEDGKNAEQLGQPLPPGYEDLRDELIAAARVRCTEIAVAAEPPLMYTNCLSVDTSLPYAIEDAACTVCVEAGVWNGGQHEVECPPGLEGTTAAELGTSTMDAATTGNASLDETGTGDGSGFGLRAAER